MRVVTVKELSGIPGRFRIQATDNRGRAYHVADSNEPGDAAATALQAALFRSVPYVIIGSAKVLEQIPVDLRSRGFEMKLTAEQFDALSELLRLRDSAAVVASRAHFVDGLTIGDAARKAGITYNGAHQAVRRVKRGIELVIKAAGSNNETI